MLMQSLFMQVAWPLVGLVAVTFFLFWFCRVYRKNAITDLSSKDNKDRN